MSQLTSISDRLFRHAGGSVSMSAPAPLPSPAWKKHAMNSRLLVGHIALTLAALLASYASAQSPAPMGPTPPPLVQVEPLPHFQARFLQGDRELTRYHFDPVDRRSFLYPLTGPSGLSLTRMGHPRDPVGHSHHNSAWIAHHIVDGTNFWGDRGAKLGRVVTQMIEQIDDRDDGAWLTAVNHWIADDTKETLLVERRRMEVLPSSDGQFLTLIDLEFMTPKRAMTFEKTTFGLLAVRMRKSIGVHDGGGRILNSEGAVNEKGTDGTNGVFWKPAKWCDYSGPVTATASEGIAIFDHPKNHNFPTEYHVRDDGWMGTCLTHDGPLTLQPGEKLKLRYGLYVHGGVPDVSALDAQWETFAKLPVPETLEKPKPAKK
ncbi:MAG: hypothetical protein C0483_09125 [Pirellula sp.]|nr:hypothetical protein [Pirellula sp.]